MSLSVKIHPTIVYRVAAIPNAAYKEQSIEQFLADPYFRSALFLASPQLYIELEKHEFKFYKLPEKLRLTLKKYANRITHRTTPFGAFSGFGAVHINGDVTAVKINTEKLRMHLLPDFRSLLNQWQADLPERTPEAKIRTNASIYLTKKDIRFIYYEVTSEGGRSFRINMVEKNGIVERIIKYCKTECTCSHLQNFIVQKLQVDKLEAEKLMIDLLNLQLITFADEPHITGPDLTQSLQGQKRMLLSREGLLKLPKRAHINTEIPEFPFYANLEIPATGNISNNVLDQLNGALTALHKFSDGGAPDSLTRFANSFSERFGDRAVPLMTALDPELGVSYEDLAQSAKGSPLLDELDFSRFDTTKNLSWGAVNRLLMNKWPGDCAQAIVLKNEDLEGLPEPARNNPPSFSVPFRMVDDQVILEKGGGNSALALIGRFTPFCNPINDLACEIAQGENDCNPGVRFAEIACITDGKTDNINRRNGLRALEILIRTGSVAKSESQIQLSDLYISVQYGQVLLWSEKLRERIIPRLSTAYNFQRSDLPVFRFLCDLQYQALQHSWSLDLTRFFPGLAYYPRVSYGNCILCLAHWNLDQKDLGQILLKPRSERFIAFTRLAAKLCLPRYFALTQHDQYLVFDQTDKGSIELLLSLLVKSKDIRLTEVIREKISGGKITNENGQTHSSQFIASVINKSSSYTPNHNKPILNERQAAERSFLPGSEWIYYKVYCPVFNSDEILIKIERLINKLHKQNLLKRWFFIRYNDPEPHLRIRVCVTPETLATVAGLFNLLFERLQINQQLAKVQMDTYERELERYANISLEFAEKNFEASSGIVLSALRSGLEPHVIALRTVYEILQFFLRSPDQRLHFIAGVRDNLFAETGGGKLLREGIEAKKRHLKKEVEELMQDEQFYTRSRLSGPNNKFLSVLKEIQKNGKQLSTQIIADLIHMHINRCFSSDMRRQELLVYTLLFQYELMTQKNNKSRITF